MLACACVCVREWVQVRVRVGVCVCVKKTGGDGRVCEMRDDLLRPTIEFVSQQIHF